MFKSRQARTFVRTGNEKRPKQGQRVATPMWSARGAGNSSFLAHRGNSLDSELLRVQALRKLLGEDYTVKRLTVALLVCSVFPPTVFAQCIEVVSVEETEHRSRIFSDWLEMVKGAEMDYKHKNGRFGDLSALRKAHLLRSLVFESGSSAPSKSRSEANFVPKRTLFQRTVWVNGEHFRAAIGDKCVSVNAADTASGVVVLPLIIRDFRDSPEGPIIPSLAR